MRICSIFFEQITARIDTVSIFKFQVIFHDIPGQIAAYAAMINIVNNIIFKIFDIIEFLTYINQKFWISKGIVQIATFCGQQGRISRTVRAILSGQFEGTAGLGYPGPANQY